MSENTEKVVKDTDKKKDGLRAFIWFMMGVVVGIVAGYGLFFMSMSDAVKSVETSQIEVETEVTTTGGDALSITTYSYEHTVLTGEDVEKAQTAVLSRLEKLKDGSTYVQLQVGEDTYESYMYNKNNECFAQASDGSYSAIFRNDGKAVKYEASSGAVAVGSDIDLISFAENAMTAVSNGVEGAQLFEMTPSNEESTVVEYRVDLVGDEAVKACYSSIGEDFGQVMLDNLMEALPDWEPHIIMIYLVDLADEQVDLEDIAMYCYYVDNDTEYANWTMQGCVEVNDWSLSEDWYTYDFSNTVEEDFNTMLNELVATLTEVIDTYAEENNLEIIEVEPETLEENTEGSTTEVEEETSTEEIEAIVEENEEVETE